MKKKLTVLAIALILTLPFAFLDILPSIGDVNSAPNKHVSAYYIENAIPECNSPNMVTAVIVDYRAFDTLLETTVMFLAGAVVLLVLARKPSIKNRIVIPKSKRMHKDKSGNPIYKTVNKDVMITVIQPLILVYAVYVLFHGEVSLGGGFQAGALIAMAYILDVLVIPDKKSVLVLPKKNSVALAGLGPFIYTLTGIICLIGGGMFLEYAKLPFPVHTAELHSIGILAVEVGVTIGVAATIITILNAIMERVTFDDDNY